MSLNKFFINSKLVDLNPRILSYQGYLWKSLTYSSNINLNLKNRRFYSTFLNRSYSSLGANHNNEKKKKSLWVRVKAATTFTASGVLVIGATGLASIVIYLILSELFSPSGDTQMFNRAVTLIENDTIARSLLQCDDSEEHGNERLKAYGEILTSDKWTRNRPISSTRKVDSNGKVHYFMRFHVESRVKRALVHIEAKESEHYQPDFVSVYLDIPGEKRYYLIKPPISIVKPKGFLGVNWGPKKD